MNTEKRMIHSYEVVSAFRIGGKEVVFAMDEKNTDGEKFMTCFVLFQMGAILFRNNGMPMVLLSGLVSLVYMFKKYT